jgi:hypothetical protein
LILFFANIFIDSQVCPPPVDHLAKTLQITLQKRPERSGNHTVKQIDKTDCHPTCKSAQQTGNFTVQTVENLFCPNRMNGSVVVQTLVEDLGKLIEPSAQRRQLPAGKYETGRVL